MATADMKEAYLDNHRESFMGITIRKGIRAESTGIRLRAVNPRMQE
jgi:hypothetical protein